MDGVIGLEMLHFHDQLRPLESLATEIELPEVKKEELRLASKLIEASTSDRFDFADYRDTYTQKLKEVIDAKAAGREIVRAPEEEAPTINLMDALRKSVAQGRRASPERPRRTTPTRTAKPRRTKNSRRAG